MALTDTSLHSFRVLIVEDNRDGADTLAALLQTYGFEVRVAYTGPDGLQAALDDPPDAVVCDINLPGLDGLTIARRLREALPEKPLMVAVSAMRRRRLRRPGREGGVRPLLRQAGRPGGIGQRPDRTGRTGLTDRNRSCQPGRPGACRWATRVPTARPPAVADADRLPSLPADGHCHGGLDPPPTRR